MSSPINNPRMHSSASIASMEDANEGNRQNSGKYKDAKTSGSSEKMLSMPEGSAPIGTHARTMPTAGIRRAPQPKPSSSKQAQLATYDSSDYEGASSDSSSPKRKRDGYVSSDRRRKSSSSESDASVHHARDKSYKSTTHTTTRSKSTSDRARKSYDYSPERGSPISASSRIDYEDSRGEFHVGSLEKPYASKHKSASEHRKLRDRERIEYRTERPTKPDKRTAYEQYEASWSEPLWRGRKTKSSKLDPSLQFRFALKKKDVSMPTRFRMWMRNTKYIPFSRSELYFRVTSGELDHLNKAKVHRLAHRLNRDFHKAMMKGDKASMQEIVAVARRIEHGYFGKYKINLTSKTENQSFTWLQNIINEYNIGVRSSSLQNARYNQYFTEHPLATIATGKEFVADYKRHVDNGLFNNPAATKVDFLSWYKLTDKITLTADLKQKLGEVSADDILNLVETNTSQRWIRDRGVMNKLDAVLSDKRHFPSNDDYIALYYLLSQAFSVKDEARRNLLTLHITSSLANRGELSRMSLSEYRKSYESREVRRSEQRSKTVKKTSTSEVRDSDLSSGPDHDYHGRLDLKTGKIYRTREERNAAVERREARIRSQQRDTRSSERESRRSEMRRSDERRSTEHEKYEDRRSDERRSAERERYEDRRSDKRRSAERGRYEDRRSDKRREDRRVAEKRSSDRERYEDTRSDISESFDHSDEGRGAVGGRHPQMARAPRGLPYSSEPSSDEDVVELPIPQRKPQPKFPTKAPSSAIPSAPESVSSEASSGRLLLPVYGYTLSEDSEYETDKKLVLINQAKMLEYQLQQTISNGERLLERLNKTTDKRDRDAISRDYQKSLVSQQSLRKDLILVEKRLEKLEKQIVTVDHKTIVKPSVDKVDVSIDKTKQTETRIKERKIRYVMPKPTEYVLEFLAKYSEMRSYTPNDWIDTINNTYSPYVRELLREAEPPEVAPTQEQLLNTFRTHYSIPDEKLFGIAAGLAQLNAEGRLTAETRWMLNDVIRNHNEEITPFITGLFNMFERNYDAFIEKVVPAAQARNEAHDNDQYKAAYIKTMGDWGQTVNDNIKPGRLDKPLLKASKEVLSGVYVPDFDRPEMIFLYLNKLTDTTDKLEYEIAITEYAQKLSVPFKDKDAFIAGMYLQEFDCPAAADWIKRGLEQESEVPEHSPAVKQHLAKEVVELGKRCLRDPSIYEKYMTGIFKHPTEDYTQAKR